MASTSRTLRANLDVVILIAIVLVVTSFAVVRTYALYENRLAVHPEWTSTKTTLRRGVMGAIAYVAGQQALARNRLDLGAWFGHQEVTYRDSLNVASVEFRFRLDSGAYVHAVYDRRAAAFSGVRFSSRTDLPSKAYSANPDGEFTTVHAVSIPAARPGVWHEAKLAFTDRAVAISLDGAVAGSVPRIPGPQRIGFRGGHRAAFVDDVIVTTSDGRAIVERFTNTRQYWARWALAFVALWLVLIPGVAAARRYTRIDVRQALLASVVVSMVLAVVAGAAYALQYVRGVDYDVPTGRYKRAESYWIESAREDVMAEIKRRYPPDVPPNVFRILVLGASQTWGAGAVSEGDTWVRRLEARLNEGVDRGVRVECINAGVSGYFAGGVLDMLRQDLAGMTVNAALVNLSSNDTDTTRFRQDLEAIARELSARGVRTVFSPEPNSPEREAADTEHGDLAAKHAIMRAVAHAHGFPVTDLQTYLDERRDAGLVWWDFVHLTSFGQRLVAERLATALPPLVGLE